VLPVKSKNCVHYPAFRYLYLTLMFVFYSKLIQSFAGCTIYGLNSCPSCDSSDTPPVSLSQLHIASLSAVFWLLTRPTVV
jgi:hypothetical protein